MQIVTTRIAIVSDKGDNPIFGESVTEIILSDDGAGFFITLKSLDPDLKDGQVKINANELDVIVRVAKEMIRDANKAMEEQK